MAATDFRRLFEPIQIGPMVAKNRIKFASTTTLFCNEDGSVSDRDKAFLAERARGGAGLVTTGGSHVTAWGQLFPRMPA